LFLLASLLDEPSQDETVLIMLSMPLALVEGLWLIWSLGHAVSVASVIGFITLGAVAAEFGVVMLLHRRCAGSATHRDSLRQCVRPP
jgi:copper/silver efflux system protein